MRIRELSLACAIAAMPATGHAAECTTTEGQRAAFTLEEQNAAVVPGIPDARFFADDIAGFLRAVPKKAGVWLALSGGGADGAYAAGVLNGWSATGKRPEFSVVTGISTGAAIAPFAFLGREYDAKVRENYTAINAGDIFEDIDTDQSLLDTWPLKDLIARQATPELVAAVAKEHKKGRRLFVATVNLDSERRVIWNMGAIASRGDERALALFRDVLLASSSVPGLFPPVAIDLESGGKCVREVHIDGSAGGAFYIAPDVWLAGNAQFKLPAKNVYVLLNAREEPYFEMVQQNVLSLLGRAISMTLKYSGRIDAQRVAAATARDGIPYEIAVMPEDFTKVSQGAFDGVYMKELFDRGEKDAREGKAFRPSPPPQATARSPE